MFSVRDLMTKDVVIIDLNKTILDAAALMSEKERGCLVIMDGKKSVGIVTERDFVRRFAVKGLLAGARVSSIMSKPLITVDPDASLTEASELMIKNKIRRLPAVKKNKLVGIIVVSDFARYLSKRTISKEILEAMARFPQLEEL